MIVKDKQSYEKKTSNIPCSRARSEHLPLVLSQNVKNKPLVPPEKIIAYQTWFNQEVR